MAFERYPRGRLAATKAPVFTVQKRGYLSFNQAAWEMIGSPEHINLLFDPENRVIALEPTTDTPGSYPVRTATTAATGTRVVSASSFTNNYDIDTTQSRRYVPVLRDGLLCVDLRSEALVLGGTANSRDTGEGDAARDK